MMRIIGPEELHFGTDNPEDSKQFLNDFGLKEVGNGKFEAVDGSCVVVKQSANSSLPKELSSGHALRETVWGVEDEASLDEIEAELSKDREVVRGPDGALRSRDDLDFAIGFQVSRRRELKDEPELINAPGVKDGRALNKIGADDNAEALPLTLSHVVYFVPDLKKMEDFYIERLQFKVVDRFLGMGPFLSPKASTDHHALFLIQSPEYMQGLEHCAFHMQGPSALMAAGHRMREKGYDTFWGPGKHKFGSNWFWYFKSPFGSAFEYDADMDRMGDDWQARELPAHQDNAQQFLLKAIDKWAPGGPPAGEDG